MPKLQPHPLKYRELISRLNLFGVIEHPNYKRGRGSERILILAANYDPNTGRHRGAQYPVKHHGDGTEIYVPVISKIIKRFNIDSTVFWTQEGTA